VADWDDTIQLVRPMVIWLNTSLSKNNSSIKEFATRFWENSVLIPNRPSASIIGEYHGSPEEKEAVEEFEKKRSESRKNPEKHIFNPIDDFYNKTPFLSTADDLLKALKEGLISEIVLISCYRKGKNQKNQDEQIYKRVLSGVTAINKNAEKTTKEKVAKIEKTFGKLPQTKIEMTAMTRPSIGDKKSPEFKPYRWEVLRDKYPDFDILIDDNPQIIKECAENLPSDKAFALCDYRCNRGIVKADNVYMFPVTVSDIKDEDFVISTKTPEPKNNHQRNPSSDSGKSFLKTV
jgi:hypothetical protein